MSKVGINERATVPSRKAVRFPSPPIKTLEEDAKQQVFSQANELATLRIEYEALQARFDKVSALVSDVGVGLMTTNFGREYEERELDEHNTRMASLENALLLLCDGMKRPWDIEEMGNTPEEAEKIWQLYKDIARKHGYTLHEDKLK